MADIEQSKRLAGEAAADQVQSGMIVGLGTGSTAIHAVRRIGALLTEGTLQRILAIPTSEETAREAQRLGIPLVTLDEHPVIDVTIDGADEVDPHLNLIKGLGGALLREKVVAAASRRMIIVADDRKVVDQLGTRAPVPVESIVFARRPVTDHLVSLGARVVERQVDGRSVITDEGNILLDSYFPGIENPRELDRLIRSQPGVVEHGLFLGLATEAIIAGPDGLTFLHG